MNMHYFPLIFLLTIVSSSCYGENSSVDCKKVWDVTQSFIYKPTAEGWDTLSLLAEKPNAASCDCSVDVSTYHTARIRRDLPNSQSLIGITPKQFVEQQQRRIAELTNHLRTCNSANLRLLIHKMKNQNFDPEVARSAQELEKQLQLISEKPKCFLWIFGCS